MGQKILCQVIRYRAVVYLLSAAIAICASIAASRLPIDALPDLSEHQVLVYTRWPDHTPSDIYQRITHPLEESIRQVDGVQSVRGSSDVGFSLLVVLFDQQIDLLTARQRLMDQLKTANVPLPEGVQPQVAPPGIATGQIVWYTLRGADTNLMEVRAWQDKFIAPRLRAVAGVSEVASVGGFEPEWSVDLNATAMMNRGLALSDVQEQLRGNILRPVHSAIADRPAPPLAHFTDRLNQITEELRAQPVSSSDGASHRLGDLATVELKPAPRYGAFEQDGTEVVAGVVHMLPGGNTLSTTQAVLEELRAVQRELPDGWRCVPCYDRSPLIQHAIGTVTKTLLEALLVTGLSILIVMRHWRATIVVAIALPMAVLMALLGMACLPALGIAMNANIMSLAGIAVSVGLLVDASVVIVENVMVRLHDRYGTEKVTGNTDQLVAEAAAQVAWPAAMAIVIMLISFWPLFALRGLDGQMLHPLLWTKAFTLIAVLILAVTLVPCLARDLLRGRMHSENESRLLQGIRSVYEPTLRYCFHRTGPLIALLSLLSIAGCAATGLEFAVRIAVVCGLALNWLAFPKLKWKVAVCLAIIFTGLTLPAIMRPISAALRIPLDEGMIMDMPITVPRTQLSQAIDDLKARDMVLCRFPEVAMVSGKVGRAETAFDPAPIDMIETMVEFRPDEFWPRRRLMIGTAREQAHWLLVRLIESKLIESPSEQNALIEQVVSDSLPRFDAISREVCWQAIGNFEERLRVELLRQLTVAFLKTLKLDSKSSNAEASMASWLTSRVALDAQLLMARQPNLNSVDIVLKQLEQACRSADFPWPHQTAQPASSENQLQSWTRQVKQNHRAQWTRFTRSINATLEQRAATTWNQLVCEAIFTRVPIIDSELRSRTEQSFALRYRQRSSTLEHHGDEHSNFPGTSELPVIDPHRVFDRVMQEATRRMAARVWLWAHTPATLTDPTGELDQSVQMPGWANVWTRPIQNRIDMLTTGVNAEVGIRVSGDEFQQVVRASEELAEIVKTIPGAVGVIADPIRGKDYIEVTPKAESSQVAPSESRLAIDAATIGISQSIAIQTKDDRTDDIGLRITVQIGHDKAGNQKLESTEIPLRRKLDDDRSVDSSIRLVALDSIGSLTRYDGPASIKSTDGRLSNYVRLNVVGRSSSAWVKQAQQVLGDRSWPSDISIAWTGRFEHTAQTQRTLVWIVPGCLLLIVMTIYLTFRDVADTVLVLLALPGALMGAVLLQWALGMPISLSVVVGYISCLGMAAATGMVMIVYLRDAVARAAVRNQLHSESDLEQAVINGAVHRLRPKLLTEVAMIISLMPLLWSSGAGADVIRPMAAPVLGGILIADEIVDLLLPVLFFRVRRQRWLRRWPGQSNDEHVH